MTTLPLFLNADLVASQIGLQDGNAFLRQRARLERENLFPLPLPVRRRPMLWRGDEVAAWLDRMGRPALPDISPDDLATGRVVMMQMARTA
ncbi:hypothetical protein MASR1M32_10220 [Rhodobacter sp.]